jgi:hypothetical protein
LFADDRGADSLAAFAAASDGTALFDAARRRAVFRRDFDGAEILLRAMFTPDRSVYERLKGASALGALLMGRGRVEDARNLLLSSTSPNRDAEPIAIFVQSGLAAGYHDGPASPDSLRAAVEAWYQRKNAFERTSRDPDVAYAYLSGLIAAHTGDSRLVARFAALLDGLRPGRRGMRDAGELAGVVRAYADLQKADCSAALRRLDQAAGVAWFGPAASSPLDARSFDRVLRAECHRTLSQFAEAIARYQTMKQYTIYDLGYLAISLRGQAAAHRARGDQTAEREAEMRLAALSRRADRRE